MASADFRYEQLSAVFEPAGLFDDDAWLRAPEPYVLTDKQWKSLEEIGQGCADFYAALELLYRFSVEGRNLLRNGELYAPWVAEYLDRGKPPALVEHGRRTEYKGAFARVLCPDLLLTKQGFVLTDLDSGHHGLGLTSFLNQAYRAVGETSALPEGTLMDGFYEALAALLPDQELPLIAIVVSEESASARPEYQWLAEALRKRGKPVYCLEPQELMPLGKSLCAPVEGSPERIDIVFRVFELFDLRNISTSDAIFDSVEAGEVVVTPPMREFLEEKLVFGLFHHPLLGRYWKEHLARRSHKTLSKIIPKTWIVDPVELPPCSVLNAPTIGGQPIIRWEQLAEGSQRERNQVLKVSGFHKNSRGSESIVYGNGVSRELWLDALREAVEEGEFSLRILQEYQRPARIKEAVFTQAGQRIETYGALRLCPYYFVHQQQAKLGGVHARFYPENVQELSEMQDRMLYPCKKTV